MGRGWRIGYVRRGWRILVAGLIIAAGATQGAELLPSGLAPVDAAADGQLPAPTAKERARTLSFATEVGAADRRTVVAAIAGARPEARRLVDLVDGFVEVRLGGLGPGQAVGLTESRPEGHVVTLSLAEVAARDGDRGVRRLVLHELGHVVDYRLVPPELAAQLDAAIPRGYDTGAGATGSSATREERFAESFAKWALDDIGVDVYLGYRVPPPPLDWGAPLNRLR